MDEGRLKRARRLHDVLRQLHEIEEHRKLVLQRRFDELEESQRELIHGLNRDDALHGLFMDTTARFLKSLAQEAKRVADAKELQTQRVLERATQMKTAERLKNNLDERVARSTKERELYEIIERYSGRRRASLP
jgi:hypothetical protein